MSSPARRFMTLTGTVVGMTLVLSAPAFAHECFNVSKNEHNPGAGAQVVLGPDDEIVSATNGVVNRIEHGLIDPETGEGFHGIIAFDEDGDGVADASTYIVGPNDEIPEQAQERGAECAGIVNIEYYFETCLAG